MLFGYQIVGFLGRGGFGITYRAVDRINQVFALKECLPRQFAVREATTVLPADDDYAGQMFTKCLESFTKEALALTRFSKSGAAGDGVVKVITSFETNGTAYIVMEFVEGDSLERLIGAHPGGVPEPRLVPIFRHLTSTLACVHGYELLHRDIKPANLILREDGRPVLLDFGAARAVRADGPMPSQIYTETYAPIEQIEGRQQGPFSDLYSLGVTCYQAVAGSAFRNAPASDRYRALLRHEPDPLVPALEIGAGRYSPSLLRAIDVLLRVAPEERPQSVDEFLPHLAGVESQEPDSDATRIAGPEVTQGGGAARNWASTSPATASAPSTAETVFSAVPVSLVSARSSIADAPTLFVPSSAQALASTAPPARRGGGGMAVAIGLIVVLLGAAGGGAYWLVGPKAKRTATTEAPGQAVASAPAAAPASSMGPTPTSPATRAAPGLAEATQAYAQKDYATALQGYLNAAQGGDAEAQYQLGYMYQLGQGVTADPTLAMGWYQKSAAQGYAPAQSQIGYLHQYGVGIPQDYTAAAHWYGLAAAQGFKTAELQLGYLSQHGFGTPKNYFAALHLYKLAADQGSAAAQNQMGYLYQMGYGVRMNYTQAFNYYKAAAEQGLPAAQYALGSFYNEGLGVPRDPDAARMWMSTASAGGNAEARNWLATH
jgi:TPR repeat protein/serine/threonine protein kinase